MCTLFSYLSFQINLSHFTKESQIGQDALGSKHPKSQGLKTQMVISHLWCPFNQGIFESSDHVVLTLQHRQSLARRLPITVAEGTENSAGFCSGTYCSSPERTHIISLYNLVARTNGLIQMSSHEHRKQRALVVSANAIRLSWEIYPHPSWILP